MTLDRILDVIHGYWAYLVLLVLILATLNAIVKFFGNKSFGSKDFSVSLYALILTHIQVLVGLVLYFAHPTMGFASITRDDITFGELMLRENRTLRLFAIEHPMMMLLGAILITIGYSKHKKQKTSKGKFKMLAIFYTLGLIFILSRIPWAHWLG